MPGTWPTSAISRSSRPSICPSIDPSSTLSFTSSRPSPPTRSTRSSPSSTCSPAIVSKPQPENPLSGLSRIGVSCGAEHGIGTGWNDDHGSRMALVQGSIYAGSVVAAVAQEDLHRLVYLVEQGLDLRGVIDVGQDGSDYPASHRVEAD